MEWKLKLRQYASFPHCPCYDLMMMMLFSDLTPRHYFLSAIPVPFL